MYDDNYKRKVALERAKELKDKINDYIMVKGSIPRGLSPTFEKKIEDKKSKILEVLNATEDNWKDWSWQVRTE